MFSSKSFSTKSFSTDSFLFDSFEEIIEKVLPKVKVSSGPGAERAVLQRNQPLDKKIEYTQNLQQEDEELLSIVSLLLKSGIL
jgi:hypothetical protein